MHAIATAVLFAVMFIFAPAARGDDIVQVPDGGRLDALDADGNIVGACPLKHTDVEVAVAGHFTRITLHQEYTNPYDRKIEAVYTFPMSHRAAVDRMRMMVGERIIEGEVKEREEARQMYEAARDAGYVASLLEQERPNIFTQSVANIEPGESIVIEISYIETLEAKDGEYTFAFPMVVGPRYIPGAPTVSPALLPAELAARRGVTLLGPAACTLGEQGSVEQLGTLQEGKLRALLAAAQPIERPDVTFWGEDEEGNTTWPELWYAFEATYVDGSKEAGRLFVDGTGDVNGRWFFTDPAIIREMGTGFAQNTNQVPDAANITPKPTRPGTRAGHDISVAVTIDTGGVAIATLDSDLHEVAVEGEEPDRRTVRLKNDAEIPNRDFVLRWTLDRDSIGEAVLAHTTGDAEKGNFLTLIVNPPDRVQPETIRPRELIFVMDTSGSMRGFPIEKSKEVMRKAIDSMRPDDTFNLITFAGSTRVLWPEPRPVTEANRDAAIRLIDRQEGGGGTEMMTAINTALVQTTDDQPGAPGAEMADPMRIVVFLTDGYVGNDMAIIDAVRKNAKTTRVFSFGIGNSVNRYLLDGMAHAGRGEAEYVLLANEAEDAVARFTRRIETPVLTDITVSFSDNLGVHDVVPGTTVGAIPDLFDAKPLVVHAKYTHPEVGSVTIRGMTAAGPYERTIELDVREANPENDQIATLWARAKIDQLMQGVLAGVQRGNPDANLKSAVIALGVNYNIVSQFTSFVAVEKARITVGGRPMLVAVPIEMPDGVSYEGIFGDDGQVTRDRHGDLVLELVPHTSSRFEEADRELPREALRSDGAVAGRPVDARIAGQMQSAPARGRMRATAVHSALPGGGGGFGGGGGSAGPGAPGAMQPAVRALREEAEILHRDRDFDDAAVDLSEDADPKALLERLFGSTGQKHFADRLMLTLDTLVAGGHIDAAKRIAEAMFKHSGDVRAAEIHELLQDTEGDEPDETSRERIAQIAAEARETITRAIAAEVREAKLRFILEEELVPFALGSGFPDELVDAYDGFAPEGAVWHEGGIALMIRFGDLDDDAITAVTALGAKVIDRIDGANLLIVTSPLGRFDDIALIQGVKRIVRVPAT